MSEREIPASDLYATKNGIMFFDVRMFWGAGPDKGKNIAPKMEVPVRVNGKGKTRIIWRAEYLGDEPEFAIEVHDKYEYLARIIRVGESQRSSPTSVGPIRCDNSSYSMTVEFLRFYEITNTVSFMEQA